jgi:hypothetical protein
VATIDSPGAAPAASTVTGVSSADASAAASPTTCIQYGLVEDGGGLRSSGGQPSPAGSVGTRGNLVSAERPTAICSNGRDRIRHVYRSTGHVVRVWVTGGAAPTDLKRFVIHYSGKPDAGLSTKLEKLLSRLNKRTNFTTVVIRSSRKLSRK